MCSKRRGPGVATPEGQRRDMYLQK
jgi:hypothetical protein